ncbi:Cilia- and flagella-associated protein 47 [Boothiomyces sp. JEL0866]|nr:Cilia- and flagella-associated protein 47 [Boothiomyces sp. JEL0866]
MLNSLQLQNTKAKIVDTGDEKIKGDEIPRILKKDPTKPSEGTRPTFFTGLSTTSFQSVKALARRPLLEKYMNIKLSPSKIIIENYVPGQTYEASFLIQNFSKQVKYISLSSTSTKYFELARDTELNEFMISPGLEKRIKVIFKAPSSKSKSTADARLYLDKLDLIIQGAPNMTIPMEAYPLSSKLVFEDKLDFGTVIFNPVSLQQLNSVQKTIKESVYYGSSELLKNQNMYNGVKTGWLTKTLTIKNTGHRIAHISCEVDQRCPIRISHPIFKLESEQTDPEKSSIGLQVEFLPVKLGKIESKIKIRIENQILSPSQTAKPKSQQDTQFFHLIANVIDNKVRLTDLSGKSILNGRPLTFGSIFFEQVAYLPVKIENQSDCNQRWAITQSEQIAANVPDILKFKTIPNNNPSQFRKTPISVSPNEGILEPNQSVIVKFAFYPRLDPKLTGFKSEMKLPNSREYNLSMQLQIIEDGKIDNTDKQDKPIDIFLKGTALPFQVGLSKNMIAFRKCHQKENQTKTVTLCNSNPTIGVSFAFDTVAQFELHPESGELSPGESVEIDATFSPNQFGHFQTKINCIITPAVKFEEKSGLLRKLDNSILSKIPLVLIGSCLPSPIPPKQNSEQENDSHRGTERLNKGSLHRINKAPKENAEWIEKKKHCQKYIDYIRGVGTQRERNQSQIHSLKTVINPGDHLDDELLRANVEDDQNGLIPPEPIELLHQSSDQDIFSLKASKSKSKLQKALVPLYDLLESGNAIKPHALNESHLPSNWVDQILTPNDLEFIFSSTDKIDFGEVTVHSVNKLPLNFLNGSPSKVPVHISLSIISENVTDVHLMKSALSFSPPFINLAAMTVGGFELKLNSNTPVNFQGTINYIINKRYIHQIPVRAKILPINLTCSSQKVNIGITSSDYQKNFDTRDGVVSDHYVERTFQNKIFKVPTASSTISIKNNGNHEGYFALTPQEVSGNSLEFSEKSIPNEGIFEISPLSGVVPAKSSIKVNIRYIPGTKVSTERNYYFKVYDNFENKMEIVSEESIQFHGECTPSDCQMMVNTKQGPLEIGLMPISSREDPEFFYDASLTYFSRNFTSKSPITGSRIVKFKNNGSSPFVYCAYAAERTIEVEVKPHTGVVKEGQVSEIQIVVSPQNAGIFEDTIIFQVIGGGKSYRIPIKYEGRKPSIEIAQIGNNIAPDVVIGSSSGLSLQIHNRGSVFGRLVFDFTAFKEFSIVCRDERPRTGSSNPKARLTSVGSSDSRARSSNTSLNDKNQGRLAVIDGKKLKQIKSNLSNEPRFYVLDSNPGDRYIVDVVYTPCGIGHYNDSITGYLLGCSSHTGIVAISQQVSVITGQFTIPLDCKGINSPIVISSNNILFKEKIMHAHQGKSIHEIPIMSQLTLQNVSDEQVEYICQISMNDTGIFSVEPTKGVLSVGKVQKLTVTFSPVKTGSFESKLNIGIRYLNIDSSIPVRLFGSAANPTVTFSPPEIYLPVVPHSIESSYIFSIINMGCERGEILPQFPTEITKPGLNFDVIFPEGKILKSDGEKLTCMVKFTNNSLPAKPISFTVRIPFLDSEGNRFYLPVHGTSCTSMLTNLAYLWMHQPEVKLNKFNESWGYRIESTETDLGLNDQQKRAKILNSELVLRTPNGIAISNPHKTLEAEQFWAETANTLLFWLQDHIGLQLDDKPFPENLIATSGKAIDNALHSLAGKKIPGLSPVLKINTTPDEIIKNTYRHFQEILLFLISHGAMLSSMKAEYLLSQSDYQRFIVLSTQNSRLFKKSENIVHAFPETATNYGLLSKEAWCTLLLQITKVFLFQTVKPETSKTQILAETDLAEEIIYRNSNFYGYSEIILLQWATVYLEKRLNIRKQLTNFTTDFHDSVAIANLILAHISRVQDIFANFSINPNSKEQRIENAKMVVVALKEIYGSSHIANLMPTQIYQGTKLEILLLLSFLHQTLPSFIPKNSIELVGALHEKLSKTIEISNTGSRTLTYTAQITGAPEYSVREATFSLPSKSSIQFTVDFLSRFSHRVEGTLTIKSKKMGLNNSSIMVFNLGCTIDSINPVEVLKVGAALYGCPAAQIKFEVKNRFNLDGKFSIQIRQKKKTSKDHDEHSVRHDSHNPPAFCTNSETLCIRASETSTMEVSYLPFDEGLHECTILFNDPDVGEFLYKIEGQSHNPNPIEICNWSCKSNSSFEKLLRIIPSNPNRDKALNAYMAANYAFRNLLNKSRSVKDRLKSNGGIDRDTYQLPKTPLKYKIEYSSPYFKGPSEITIKPAQDSKDKSSIDQIFTELPITFLPKAPGKYVCKIVLNCIEFSDVRVYVVNGMARSEGSIAELEFNVKAKQNVVQDIPIVNTSNEDWSIKAALQGSFFTCPFSINAKAGVITNYPIAFQPTKQCEVSGQLVLTNMHTTQKYTYLLKGIATDPDPEETLDFKCQARVLFEYPINLVNSTDEEQLFEVISDLPLSNAKKGVKIAPGKSLKYQLKILPLVSGKFTKFIKFLNKSDDSYVWYAISMAVTPPPPEYKIKISSIARNPTPVEIKITNPLAEEAITYDVYYSGKSLRGLTAITIPPKQEYTYILEYSPMVPSSEIGTVKFFNPTYGEFWYSLELTATEAPPVKLSPLSCPLGKHCSTIINLENPLKEDLEIVVTNSHPQNFQFFVPPLELNRTISRKQESSIKFLLEANELAKLQIVFWPSTIEQNIEGRFDIYHPKLGNIVYLLNGIGLPPPIMEEIEIECSMGEAKNTVVNFENPLLTAMPISIKLEQGNSTDFTLVANAKTKFLQGLEELPIQVVYKPNTMSKQSATIKVESSDNLIWTYPITGIPAMNLLSLPLTIRCRAREVQEIITEVQLTGMGEDFPKEEINKSLQIHGTRISESQDLGNLKLILNEFTPFKPMDMHLEVVFTHLEHGGKWKYPVRLSASPPTVDDTIIIQGIIGKSSTIAFALKNPYKKQLKYSASFYRSASSEISIASNEGILIPESEQKEGDNLILLSYKPIVQGKSCVALLLIETDEFSLFYEIRGVSPLSKRK